MALFSFQFTGKCYVQGRQESFPRVIGEISRSAEMGDCHGQIRIRCRHTVLDIGRYFVCFYLRQHQSFQINRYRVTHMETCNLEIFHVICFLKRILKDLFKDFFIYLIVYLTKWVPFYWKLIYVCIFIITSFNMGNPVPENMPLSKPGLNDANYKYQIMKKIVVVVQKSKVTGISLPKWRTSRKNVNK